MTKPIYVTGHRNPDADSICAALAYADFKHHKGVTNCIAVRCGNSNARIDAILERCGLPLPPFIGEVTPRVRDIMTEKVIYIRKEATCSEALELIDSHDIRILPVVDADMRVEGVVSVFGLGEYFIPKMRKPREMRRVRNTSIRAIINSLKGETLHAVEDARIEDLFVRIGAMDIASFDTFSENEAVPAEKSVIVVGDRRDIQERSIDMGVRLLVVTGGLSVDPDILERARSKGTSLVVSPYDSATTAWSIRAASALEHMIEKSFVRFTSDEPLREVRGKIARHNASAFIVTDNEGRLRGLFTKTDLLKPARLRLILVDHNELNQSVPGADEVDILEIVDHHRLGNLHTRHPILFINEPVGSTCTIIADLYRRENLRPSPAIAGVMMGGVISDTLNLKSPTTTDKDRMLLQWLSEIAGTPPDDFADIIFNSGSVILAHPPDEVLRSDFKLYEDCGQRFSVSQVEELGFDNFWKKSAEILQALEKLRTDESLFFAALLVTDINSQDSLLVISGSDRFIQRIPYPAVERGRIFMLPGVVSRKKQLIPFIVGLVQADHEQDR